MLLDYNGKLKILVERDGGIGIPDPDGSLSGDTLTVFPWEIFSAIITCGCLPMDYLPIRLYKTTLTSQRAYEIVNDSGNAIGLFRSEMVLLSEEMGIVYNEEKYVKGFGWVQKECDNKGSTLVWIIDYSEIDAIEIRFNHGDDIRVTRHMTRLDSAVADEQAMVEEEINGVRRRVFPKE